MAEAKIGELEKQLAEMADMLGKVKLRADETSKELAETKKTADKSDMKTVFISKERKLSKFSGKKAADNEISVEEWIDDAIYHLKNLPGNEAQIEFLLDHLHGQARDELRVLPESAKKSPSLIFETLRQLFQDEDTVAKIHQSFYQRAQRPGESLQQYSLALMKIMDRLCKKQRDAVGNRDLMLRERFIDGVVDSQLKREMRRYALDHADISFRDFRAVVAKWCEDVGSPNTAVSVNEVRKEPDVDVLGILKAQQDLLAKQQQQLDLLTKMVDQSVSSGAVGHESHPSVGSRGGRRNVARGQSSRACFRCGGTDHLIRNCTQKKPDSQQSTEARNQTLN